METILIVGTTIVNLALIAYSIAVFKQKRQMALTKSVMVFLTIGIVFDVTATICMVLGSSKGGLTLHGFIGYSSLFGMLLDTIFSYRKVINNGLGVKINSNFMRNTFLAYGYWVVAFITGAMIVFLSR